jgi:hypothetical protein
MRRALPQALFVLIVAGLFGVLIELSLGRPDVAADVNATNSQISGLHVALPPGMTKVPEE